METKNQIIEELERFNESGLQLILETAKMIQNETMLKTTSEERLQEIKKNKEEKRKESEKQEVIRQETFKKHEAMFADLQEKSRIKKDSMNEATFDFMSKNAEWLHSFIVWNPDKALHIIETLFDAGLKAGIDQERKKAKKKATPQTTK